MGWTLAATTALIACSAPAMERVADDRRGAPAAELVAIAAARFEMGDAFGAARGRADEHPRRVEVSAFEMMRFEVTVDQWSAFVSATGHESDVERSGAGYVWQRRWRRVAGVSWRHPRGPGTTVNGRGGHPVTQVSANDAAAFCRHHGLRLPTDAEWELAARGTDGRRYPWGNEDPVQSGARRANFGTVTCCAADASDGYETTAPVGSFPLGASAFGLEDMAGNVWEWTATEIPGRPGRVALRGGGWGNNPFALRSAYRHTNPRDIGLDHVGFRCAR